ncbi:AAPT1, partial [Symbiodinium sp. KB8]
MVMTYLSQEGVQRAARYKYIGRDKSLIYAHIGSPLAQWCVDHLLPTWMAPNLVTLLGLVLLLITFSACAVLNPNLTVDGVPSHICILAAVTLTAYSILDNMDGKQARKTGTSSPLGLLFDHGCDALNATVVRAPSWRRSDKGQQHPRRAPSPAQLGPLTLFSAVGLSAASWAAPLGWSLAATGFYVSTWEEFHTGEFELPLINGPNEGIVIFVLGYLASAVLGPEWWHTPCCEVGGVSLMPLHGLLGFFAVALVATLTDSVTIILNRAHQPRNLTAEEVAAGMRVDVSMCAAWGRMLPVAAYWGVAFAGHYLAPHVVNWCPFLWYTTLGVAFTFLVTKLMLSH